MKEKEKIFVSTPMNEIEFVRERKDIERMKMIHEKLEERGYEVVYLYKICHLRALIIPYGLFRKVWSFYRLVMQFIFVMDGKSVKKLVASIE